MAWFISFSHGLQRFWHKVQHTYQTWLSSTQADEAVEEENTGKRVRVSVEDLKVISSALLHFKKHLLQRKELDRARRVAEVDERIYQMIRQIEQTREMEELVQHDTAVAA